MELASSKWSWTRQTAQSSTSPPTCVACCVLRRRRHRRSRSRRRRSRCERDKCSRGWPGLKPALTAANKWIPSRRWDCVCAFLTPVSPLFRAATVLILLGKGFIKPLLGNFSFCFIKQTCNRQPLQQLAPLQPLRRFKCSGPPSQPHDFPIAAVKSVRNFIIKETKIPLWPFDVSRGRCQIATPATLGSWGRWRHALSATHPLALSVVPRSNPLHQPKLTRCNLCS